MKRFPLERVQWRKTLANEKTKSGNNDSKLIKCSNLVCAKVFKMFRMLLHFPLLLFFRQLL